MNPNEIEKKKLSYFWFLLVCTVFLSEGRVEAYVSVDADYFKQQGQVTVERIYDLLYNDNVESGIEALLQQEVKADITPDSGSITSINPLLSIYYTRLLDTSFKLIQVSDYSRQTIISFIQKISTPHQTSEGHPSFIA